MIASFGTSLLESIRYIIHYIYIYNIYIYICVYISCRDQICQEWIGSSVDSQNVTSVTFLYFFNPSTGHGNLHDIQILGFN